MSWKDFFVANWKTVFGCFFLAIFGICHLAWEHFWESFASVKTKKGRDRVKGIKYNKLT